MRRFTAQAAPSRLRRGSEPNDQYRLNRRQRPLRQLLSGQLKPKTIMVWINSRSNPLSDNIIRNFRHRFSECKIFYPVFAIFIPRSDRNRASNQQFYNTAFHEISQLLTTQAKIAPPYGHNLPHTYSIDLKLVRRPFDPFT